MRLNCQKADSCRSWCSSQIQDTCKAIFVLLVDMLSTFFYRDMLSVLLSCLKADMGRLLMQARVEPRRHAEVYSAVPAYSGDHTAV